MLRKTLLVTVDKKHTCNVALINIISNATHIKCISIVIISNVVVSMLRLACKGLPGTYVPAYFAHVTKKKKVLEHWAPSVQEACCT